MDITSFILGISFVIVVALVTGVVIGLIKIKRLIGNQRDLWTAIGNNRQNVYKKLTAITDNEIRRWEEHQRSLDSRLDKIISRVQILEKKIDDSKQFDGQTFDIQIKALDSGLRTLQNWSRDINTKLLSRIETLEKESVSANKNKQLLND